MRRFDPLKHIEKPSANAIASARAQELLDAHGFLNSEIYYREPTPPWADRSTIINEFYTKVLPIFISTKTCPPGTTCCPCPLPCWPSMRAPAPQATLDKLNPKNMVTIDHLLESIHGSLNGRFLLCRTIAPAIRFSALATIIEDYTGEKAVRLGIFNLSPESKVIPMGTFLAILNPHMSKVPQIDDGFSVQPEDPEEVIFLNTHTVKRLLDGKGWKGQIPAIYKGAFNSAVKQNQSVSEYHFEGNLNFAEKRFYDSVDCYSKALELDPENTTFYNNRAAAYNALGLYDLAIQDGAKVLQKEPHNVKAIHRVAKAMACKGEFSKAENFLNEEIPLVSKGKWGAIRRGNN